jgi:hypothetical protein
VTTVQWLVLGAGLVAIGLVNWWFLGNWPGRPRENRGQRH